MSRIHELGATLSGLPSILAEYEDAFDTIDANLKVAGKTHDKALQEQATWPIYYSQRRAELKTLMKYMDAEVESVRGRLTRKYNEGYSVKLSERDREKYINAEPDYRKIHELYLEVAELYDKFDAAVDAFEKRGYALRDLTLARTAKIENALL